MEAFAPAIFWKNKPPTGVKCFFRHVEVRGRGWYGARSPAGTFSSFGSAGVGRAPTGGGGIAGGGDGVTLDTLMSVSLATYLGESVLKPLSDMIQVLSIGEVCG